MYEEERLDTEAEIGLLDEKKRWERLFNAIEQSYRALDPFRCLNRFLIKEYAGPTYGAEPGRKKYLNKLNQAVDAYMMLLAANRPRVQIIAQHPSLRAFAKHYEVAINNMLQEIAFEHTVREWVLNAFFCVGIIRTHYADSGELVFEGDTCMDPGTPFASNVYLDDWVHDVTAKKFSQVKFAGNMYRITWSQFRQGIEDGMYEADAARHVKPSSKVGGLDEEDDTVAKFARGEEVDNDEYEPMVDLADIYLPADKKIYTFAVDSRSKFKLKGFPLAVVEERKDRGPYTLLSFADVPENIMPTSPASHLVYLDQLINSLMRKVSNQAQREKENMTYTGGGKDAADALTRSKDGATIKCNNLQDVGLFKQGGVSQAALLALQESLELFDVQAGNLTALLGLGAQAETVGQEQLIHSAGSRKGGQMQYRVLEATTEVIRSLGEMLWEDEFKTIVGAIPVHGLGNLPSGGYVRSDWVPGDREGNFSQFNLGINVYSMMYMPPAQQAEITTQFLERVVYPALPMLQQQGGTVDMAEIVNMYAEWLPLPRLPNIVSFTGRPTEAPPPAADAGKPGSTTRNYVRNSIPSGVKPDASSRLAQASFSDERPSGMVMAQGAA